MKSGSSEAERLVLDTSAFSRFRAGDERVCELLSRAGVILVPVIVLGELEAGFELGRRVKENRVALREFLSEPFVSVLPVTSGVARQYGRIFAQLKSDGKPIPINDVWIAACTLDSGGHLLTFDSHFRHVLALPCTILDG